MNHHNGYPFTGVLDCDLKIELFGLPVLRKMRLVYGYTPDWPYYRAKTETTEHGLWDCALSCDVEAECPVPNATSDTGPETLDILRWVPLSNLLQEGILSVAQWARIDARIDHDAKLKNAEHKLSSHHPVRRRRFNLDMSEV